MISKDQKKQQSEVFELLQQFEYITQSINKNGEMYISLNQNN